MLMKKTRISDIPRISEIYEVTDWSNPDKCCDVLAIGPGITDYTPLLNFPNLKQLQLPFVNKRQLEFIGSLNQLEKLVICSSRGVKDLEPLANLGKLNHLAFSSSLNEIDLNPLGFLSELKVLSLETSIWAPVTGDKYFCKSFAPLAKLTKLEYLEFSIVRARDGSMEPLTHLKALKKVELPNIYPIEEYARLSAALPNTKGIFHEPYCEESGSDFVKCKKCGTTDYILLLGKRRGPFICPYCDRKKLDEHISYFERLKKMYSSLEQ